MPGCTIREGLPDCDGIQLFERLQVIYPWVRGLIVSGYSAETLPEEFHMPRGTIFLPKPFSLGAFIAAIRELLLQLGLPNLGDGAGSSR